MLGTTSGGQIVWLRIYTQGPFRAYKVSDFSSRVGVQGLGEERM